jgi:hypothetical protein
MMNVVPLFGGKIGEAKFRYKCSSCDQVHEGLPDITFEMPDPCHDIGTKKRAEQMLLTTDFCILEGRQYFVRCVMEAPVHGFSQRFGWGVWCKLEWKAYKLCWDRFEENDNNNVLPLKGVLANNLLHYPDTLGRACTIQLQNERMRPLVFLDNPDHPLTVHQREGMTLDEAIAQAREIGALLVTG